MSTREQLADTLSHLQDPEDAPLILNTLVSAGKAGIPPEATQHEKDLFTHQLELVRTILLGKGEERVPNRAAVESHYAPAFAGPVHS
jgi:hypothetical protein